MTIKRSFLKSVIKNKELNIIAIGLLKVNE